VRAMTHRDIRRGVTFGLAFVVATVAADAPEARPLIPAERRYSPFLGDLPRCDDPAVLERIQSRFRDREAEFWSTGLEIVGFAEIHEIGYRTNGLDLVPRRYCSARAILGDQKTYPATYNIIEDAGIIGIGFGVEWCLTGLDRLSAFAPRCMMARP